MADWVCPDCGRRFTRQGQSHSCGRHSVADVFPDRGGRAIVAAVHAASPPGTVLEATKTQVGLRRRTRFAWLWRPPGNIGRLPPGAVVLSLALARRIASPRPREVVEARPGLFVHHVVVQGPDAIDAELTGWLQEAWQRAA